MTVVRMAYHGIAPSFGDEGVAKDLDRVPRVDVTRVQRGEAESHHVGRPEVADDSTTNQGAPFAAFLVHQLDEQARELLALGAGIAEVHAFPHVQTRFEWGIGQHRRGADTEPAYPLRCV